MIQQNVAILGNRQEWCEYSLHELLEDEHYRISNQALPQNEKSLKGKIARLHFSTSINNVVTLPFKNVWYQSFLDYLEGGKVIDVFIFYDRNPLANDEEFLEFLHQKREKAKFIYIYTNIVSISGAERNRFVQKLPRYYDLICTYDHCDAEEYGYYYFPQLYYTENTSQKTNIANNKTILYVGAAKNRLKYLISIYEKLTQLGFSCDFHIINVDPKDQKYADRIHYNEWLDYEDVIKRIKSSAAIIDVIQDNSKGFTLKLCEAVSFNKILITTNENTKRIPGYDERFIKIINSPDDVKVDLLQYLECCQYGSETRDYFSARRNIEAMISRVVLS